MERIKPAISVENLSFNYDTHPILDNVNVEFRANTFSVLLGINGSGKSTFFKLIAGLLQHKQEGNIQYFGKEIHALRGKEQAQMLGFLPQTFQSVFSLTVKEILQTGRAAYSRFALSSEDKAIVAHVLEKMELQKIANSIFNELSGGQQQRCLIARILVQNPKIILLDEPTNHLDIHHQHALMRYLQQLTHEGYTVVAIMHDPTLAHRYADELFYLHDKKIHTHNKNINAQTLQELEKIFAMPFLHLKTENEDLVMPQKMHHDTTSIGY